MAFLISHELARCFNILVVTYKMAKIINPHSCIIVFVWKDDISLQQNPLVYNIDEPFLWYAMDNKATSKQIALLTKLHIYYQGIDICALIRFVKDGVLFICRYNTDSKNQCGNNCPSHCTLRFCRFSTVTSL